ncbi:MAG: hypothetical protein ICV51_06910 [Flavisolibacter sp.]|nr:hypothetical protein [Flavisolibacter sp.]MBD0286969.1 hypothetical protein [Flavisolibacter sp.]MBD0295853.1 hypothetical protein [Flavisolibacter sp.]MBD0351655.1 hypothetical protein [Flavisolibacter sp.]MBD0368473.1 hypothetical protein [Flavisolibacter sp.]
MNDTVQIPRQEYEALKEEIALLKDNELLQKVNRLVDLLFEEKYGLYLGNYTGDLTEAVLQNAWPSEKSAWDNV